MGRQRCTPYLGHSGSWDLHGFEEFGCGEGWRWDGSGVGPWEWGRIGVSGQSQQTPQRHRYFINVQCFILLGKCVCQLQIIVYGASPPDSYHDCAPILRWGTNAHRRFVPTLPPNSNYIRYC